MPAPGPPAAPPLGVADLATAPLPPAATTDAGVRVLRAVPFAAPDGVRPLELDVHLPAGPGRETRGPAGAPLVVLVHGGGWRRGSRTSFGPVLDRLVPTLPERLALAGLAVASVDYRLSGEAVFPAQRDDVLAALAFLAARASEIGADRQRCILWGESAGGHLAALAGLAATDPSRAGGPALPRVVGVVDWYGPSDLLSMSAQRRPDAVADPDAPDSRESLLLGAPVQTVPERARAASPVHQVHGAAPPFLLGHGLLDRFVPVGQSLALRDALAAADVRVTCRIHDDADHLWLGLADPLDPLAAAVDFVHEVCGTP